MNKRLFIILSVIMMLSCSKGNKVHDNSKDILFNLVVNASITDDPLAINQDQTFSSIAVYMFKNDASFALERYELMPSFTSVNSIDIPIETQAGSKIIYLIANYSGKTLKLSNGTPLTLGASTTKQQLDDIIVESSGGFSPASLIMVGTQTLNLTSADNNSSISMLLRRLQARVDVHVYKGSSFLTNNVTLESVSLSNQVLNSEVKFNYSLSTPQMLASPMFNNISVSSSSVLSSFVNGTTVIQPSNANAIFYSYQNLITSYSPLPAATPQLQIKVNSNGNSYTYTGYITDISQTTNKYSLLQNNVYQVKAVVEVNSDIKINLNVLPWNNNSFDINRPIQSSDFSFGAWGNSWGGLNGKAMYTNSGNIEDAVFQFELDSPLGAEWIATVTNGLNFTFASSTAGTTTTAVSRGFANPGVPCIIAVRPTKKWAGSSSDTEFYITVGGKEITINPIIGSQRKYEGSDTRIIIRQVASYN